MKCPKCGLEMETGLATLISGRPAYLLWSREKLPNLWGELKGMREEHVTLIKLGLTLSGRTEQSCSICKNCGIAVLEYGKQDFSDNSASVESPSDFELKDGRQKW